MGKQWDGVEFFKMMAANEKAVGTLYRQLAGDAKFGGKFFENLAKDEDRHFAIYTALLKDAANSRNLMVEVTDDREQYLKLLIKNNMLQDVDKLMEKVAKTTNKDEIYDVAERSERDSVLFVQELIDLYPELKPADFRVVLGEEKDHLRQVMNRRIESKMETLRL
jgi:rubrerythrin